MTDDKKQPWDDALDAVKGSVDSAVQSVQSLVGGNVQDIKALARGQVEQAQQLTGSARIAISRLGKEAATRIKGVVQPVIQVFEQAGGREGTQLRHQIASARESVNHQLYDVQLKVNETTKAADAQLVPVKSLLADAKIQCTKLNAFRREHPEAALGGLIAVVGLPSLLLRGKMTAARNVLVAVGAGAGVAYTSDKLDAKRRRK